MLTIIVVSNRSENLRRLQDNLEATICVPFQFLTTQAFEKGLASSYNQLASESTGEFLCFVHDDVLFHSQNWGENLMTLLEDNSIGMIGIMGGRYKSLFGTSWRGGEISSYRMQVKDGVEGGKLLVSNPSNKKCDEVVCLDGAFLACTKKHWQQFPFDEDRFNGFHFYDLDISLQMHSAGLKNVVTYDILLEHFSQGKPSTVYLTEFLKFQQKWMANLPLCVDDVSKKQKEHWDGYAMAETLSLMKRLSFSRTERRKQLQQYHVLYKNWYHVLRSFYFGFLK